MEIGDIQNINIPDLIKSNEYYQYMSLIKNYEDTLQKVFTSSKDSHILTNPFVFLWKATSDLMFQNITELDLKIFGIEETGSLKNIVISGPYIRSYFVNIDSKTKIRNEIYLYRTNNVEWEKILDLSIFTEKKTEYVLNNDNIKIYLVKKNYKSPAHVILQHDYLKRIGWFDGNFYTSSMFLIEFHKHLSLLRKDFRDPIINIPYDPLDIYHVDEKDKSNPIRIIDMIDYNELLNIQPKLLTKSYDSKTCIELCLDKFIKEEHPLLSNQLKQMIIHLSGLKYKRPPCAYAKILSLDSLMPSLYKLLKNIKCDYFDSNIDFDFCDWDSCDTIEDVNMKIFEFIISKNDKNNFIDFLDFSKQKINKNILNYIIKYNALQIAELLITENLIEKSQIYYLILMIENLEFIQLLEIFDSELATNYLSDILENGKIRSFFFLYESDNSIINTKFESEQNILHKIRPVGNFPDLIELITKLNPELINLQDSNKETPLLFHSKHNPELIEQLIKYDFDFTLTDNDGNTILHNLSLHNVNRIKNFKELIKQFSELIDMPNQKGETCLILSCKNNNEDMFYMLKSLGANTNSKDYYGNTAYHYICANSMCLGMAVVDSKNYFGLTPKDYCKISCGYWSFI